MPPRSPRGPGEAAMGTGLAGDPAGAGDIGTALPPVGTRKTSCCCTGKARLTLELPVTARQ